MDNLWFRPLIWLDYRLAILFALILPGLLIIWALIQRSEAIERLLIIYWRVASLLLISVYLMVPTWPIAFVIAIAARILIALALWFWVDLNDEIRDSPASLLKLVTTSWRWAITAYCSVGIIALVPFLPCTFTPGATNTPFCQIWSQAPWFYKQLMHPNATSGFVGFLGIIGLVIYILYFLSFLIFRLGKQGRSALEQ
ncbi:MAG: DUF3177 family protein [Microcystaceae cyanobacterium]